MTTFSVSVMRHAKDMGLWFQAMENMLGTDVWVV